ncbi:hypothetical protein ACFQ1S_13470, partial [Kibdelosporangium lantanae]
RQATRDRLHHAAQAGRAVRRYEEVCGLVADGPLGEWAIVELVVGVAHLCDYLGLDFDAVVSEAKGYADDARHDGP